MKIQQLVDEVSQHVSLWEMTGFELVIKDGQNKLLTIAKIKTDTEKQTVTISVK